MIDLKNISGNSGIYIIFCKTTKKAYIGLATNLNSRLRSHVSDLKHNLHVNKQLQEDYNKYGSSCFEIGIMLDTGKKEKREILENLETKYIRSTQRFTTLYNCKKI